MWKSKIEAKAARHNDCSEEMACTVIRKTLQELLKRGTHLGVRYTTDLFVSYVSKSRYKVVRQELAFLLMELLDALPNGQLSREQCLRLAVLLQSLTQEAVHDVIVMLKHRENQSTIDYLAERSKSAEGRLYWSFAALAFNYACLLVGSYHFFDYYVTVEERLGLLRLICKEDQLLTASMRETHSLIYEVRHLCTKLCLDHYEWLKLHLNEHIDGFQKMSDEDFDRFYTRYEEFMTLNKTLGTAKWFTGHPLEVSRAVNQQIYFRHKHRVRSTEKESVGRPFIPRISASRVSDILKSKLSCQHVLHKLRSPEIEDSEESTSELDIP